MTAMRAGWLLGCVMALLLVAGCGAGASQIVSTATLPADAVTQAPPFATSPAPESGPTRELASSPLPTPEPTAGEATSPLPTAGAAREPLQLVVLHSNDNWGETEPCG